MNAIRSSVLASLAASLFFWLPSAAGASPFLQGAVASFPTGWSVSSGSNVLDVASTSGEGAAKRLEFDLDTAQMLSYTPGSSSDAGGHADVVISNTVFYTAYELPGIEGVGGIDSQAALCVYTNTSSGGALKYYGWAGGHDGNGGAETNLTWIALAGATPVEGATNTVSMTFDYTASPATVTFKVGDVTLYPESGSADAPAIQLSTSKAQVASIGFTGAGSFSETGGSTEPPAPSTFTVNFYESEGAATALWTTNDVPSGDTLAVYGGTEPQKAQTDEWTYRFDGWTNATVTTPTAFASLPAVVADTNYWAHFAATKRSYTITFNNYNDTELQSGDVPYGTAPRYTGSTPEKAADAQYTYTWTGWTSGGNDYATTDTIPDVTGAKTYTATFTPVEKTFTVIWKNDDGTVLETDQNVAYNAMPTYDGSTPTKDDTAQYTYTFAGWTPAVSAATDDAIYTATFTPVTRTYTVTFLDEDGTSLDASAVAYGSKPTYAGTPTKASTAEYDFTFSGWTNAVITTPTPVAGLPTVEGPVTYYAAYNASPRANPPTLALATTGGLLGAVSASGKTISVNATLGGDAASVTAPAGATVSGSSVTAEFVVPDWNAATNWMIAATGSGETATLPGVAYAKAETAWFSTNVAGLVEQATGYGDTPFVFQAPTESSAGEAVRIQATIDVTAEGSTTEPDLAGSRTGFGVLQLAGDEAASFYAYGADGWVKLHGLAPADAAGEAQYLAVLDMASGTPAAYHYVNGIALYATNALGARIYAIPLYGTGDSIRSVAFSSAELLTGSLVGEQDVSYVATVGDTAYTNATQALEALAAADKAAANNVTLSLLAPNVATNPPVALAVGESVTVDASRGSFTNAASPFVLAGDVPAGYEIVPSTSGSATTYALQLAAVQIRFLGYDGTVLQSSLVNIGDMPEYTGATPSKPSDERYNYNWTGGWTPVIASATVAADYTAAFESVAIPYAVSFYTNELATAEASWTTNVAYGTVPQYLAPEPAKAADAQYTWYFAGFTNTVATVPTNLFDAVTANVSYYAAFTNTVNTYTVTWANENGTVLENDQAPPLLRAPRVWPRAGVRA